MTDTHEKITPSSGCVFADLGVERPDYLDQAREAVENGRQEAMADGLFVGTVRALGIIEVYVAMALSQAHQDGIREGKRQAADTDATVEVTMPEWAEIAHRQFDAGAAVAQANIIAAILSAITDESE